MPDFCRSEKGFLKEKNLKDVKREQEKQ